MGTRITKGKKEKRRKKKLDGELESEEEIKIIMHQVVSSWESAVSCVCVCVPRKQMRC